MAEIADLIVQIIGFIVILYVLYRYVLPMVKNMVKNRQDTVQRQVEESAEAERLLAEAERRYESAVSDAREEAARLRDDARADATTIKEELVEQAKREVERMKQRGQEQLVAERDQLVRGLRGEVGGQSMELAHRLVVDSLTDDTSKSASVDGFLSQLGDMSARDTASTASSGGGA